MSISNYLSELDSIKKELTRLKTLTKNLNLKKTELENNVQEWLINNNRKDISYNGKIISLDNTTSCKRKKKSQKIQDLSNVLNKYGIRNNKIINEIIEANKSDRIETTKLNFKNKK